MSTTDNRIVRMQFDNAQFEAGVTKSMQTLDKLNEKLQFKEAQKGVSALQVAVAGISGIGDGVINNALKGLDKIADYSTTVIGKIKDQIKNEIASAVTSAINTITSIPSKALSQIETGGWKRATNLANAQFTVEGLGYDWDEMLKAVNYGVQDTAYGLDAAAKAASQLAASGVDFKESINGANDSLMHTSLRAISGVAAMTNSSYEEISRIFTSAAGAGAVMGDHLMQLSTRGLNAAAILGQHLNLSEAEVRDAAGKRLISFEMFAEAMDDAFGAHAKEANKTFEGSLSNMKAALSRIGAIFAQPVIDKTNTFFVAVTSRIKEFQKLLSDTKGYTLTEKGMEKIRKKASETVKQYKDLTQVERLVAVEREVEALQDQAARGELGDLLKTGVDVEEYPIMRFAGHFAEMWQSGIDAASKIVEELDLHWFTDIADFLDGLAQRIKTFFDGIINYYEGITSKVDYVAKKMRDTIGITLDDWKLINEVAIVGSYGTMYERWNRLDKELFDATGEENGSKRIQGYVDQLAMAGYSYEKLGWTEEEVRKKQEELEKSFEEQVKDLSNAEILYGNIAEVMSWFSYIAESVVGDLKLVGEGLVNIGRAIGEITLTAFRKFWEGLDMESILELTNQLWIAFRNFTATLVPSEGLLKAIGTATGAAGAGVSALIQKIIQAITLILDFATSIRQGTTSLEELTGDRTLSPLEKFSVNFVNIFTNLKTVLMNALTGIKKVLGAFKKAFTNVFKPSGVSKYVSTFTDHFSNLSELFVLSDESVAKLTSALETIFGVFKKLGTAVSNAFGKFTSFFSKKTGLGAFGKSTKDAANEIKDLSKELVTIDDEKAEGIFYRLRIILHNIMETIKSAPDKIRAFINELKNSESIENLRQAFDRLKLSIKNTIDKVLPPAEKVLGKFGAAAGEEGEETSSRIVAVIEKVADGITWLVEKITWVVNKIPEWKDAVVEFFTFVKGEGESLFDWAGKKADGIAEELGVDDLWKSLKDSWTNAANDGESVISHISTFASTIYSSLVGVINQVDWAKVGKTSLLTLTGMNLYKFFKVLDSTESIIKNIAGVPKSIGDLFSALGGVFKNAGKAITKISNVYVFQGYVAGVIGLTSAVLLLADLPFEKAKTAIAVMVIMAGVIYLLGSVAAKNNKNGTRLANVLQKSNHTFAQINAQIPALFGIAAVIASLGLFLKLVASVFEDLAPIVQKVSDEDWTKMLTTIGILAAGLIVFVGLLAIMIAAMQAWQLKDADKKNLKKYFEQNQLAETLIALSALLAAIGVALYLVSKAMIDISQEGVNVKGILVVFGILVILGAVAVFATKFSQGVNHKALLSVAVTIIAIAAAMYIIISQIVIMAAAFELASLLGAGDSIALAVGTIVGILFLIGATLVLMMREMKGMKVDAVKEIKYILLMYAGVLLALAASIKIITQAFADREGWAIAGIVFAVGMFAVMAKATLQILKVVQSSGITDKKLITIISSFVGAVLVLAVSIAIIAAAFSGGLDDTASKIIGITLSLAALGVFVWFLKETIEKLKNFTAKKVITVLASISGAILVMSVSVLIMAAAAKVMSSCNWTAVLAAALMSVGMFAVVAGALYLLLTKADAKSLDAAVDTFIKIGVVMIMIAASVLLFAEAARSLDGIKPETFGNLLIVIGIIAVVMAAIFLLTLALNAFGNKKGTDTLDKVVNSFFMFGLALLVISASVLLLGVGVQAIGKGLMYLSEGIATVAKTFNEHKAATIVILLILAAITVIVALLISKFSKLAQVTVNVGEKIFGGLSKVVTKIKDTLKGGTAKLSKWWKERSKSMKLAIGTGLITILGGIAAATPEALSQIGDMLFKVLDWLISILPKLVMWVVSFLITFLNSLADAIRSKSARLVQAIFNVVESLLEVILDVFGEAIAMLLGATGIGATFVDDVIVSVKAMKISMRSGLSSVNAYAAAMDDLNKQTEGFTKVSSAANKNVKSIGQTIKDTLGITDKSSSFNITEALDFSSMTDMNMSGMSEIQKAGDSLGFDLNIPVDGELALDNLDITKSSFANMDAAGLDAFNNSDVANQLNLNAYDTGYDVAGTYDDGVADYMEDEGYDNAEDYGVEYSNEYASGIANPDAMYQVEQATNDLADTAHTTMQSNENKEASKKAVEEGIVNPANQALVEGAAGVYQNAKTFGGAIQQGTLAGVNPDSVEDKGKRASEYIEEENDGLMQTVIDGGEEIRRVFNGEKIEIGKSYKDFGTENATAAANSMDEYTASVENAFEDSSDRTTTTVTKWVADTNRNIEIVKETKENLERAQKEYDIITGNGDGIWSLLPNSGWWFDQELLHDLIVGEAKDAAIAAAEGLEEGAGSIESTEHIDRAAKLLSGRLWDTFRSKDGIDSHSPSKKFYQAGLWCVLGIADGIRENEQQASDSMLGLSDQMIAAFGNPLEYAARMASGEIEYDPSIRPILDTSMVGVGANSINSMFDNQNVSLSGLAGTIAYDMTNLNGSNAAVVAEIQGLREDMDYMTQQMTNMQIVMDTGALVGATAGAMDKDLGMRKLYSERGDI